MVYLASFLPHLYFKSGIIDPFFNSFIFLSIYFLILTLKKPTVRKRNSLVAGIFLGLAIITKGPVALLLLLLTFVSYIIIRKGKVKIPIIGELVRKVHLNRFSLAMKMMLYSETPVLNSINLIRDMTTFYPLSIALQDVRNNLFNGKHLHEGLSQHSFFPKRYVTLIKVGEEVNQLAQMFEKLSDQLNDEIEYQTQILGRILEPVMIIFIGVFVGFILISMYLPLFELSTTIN